MRKDYFKGIVTGVLVCLLITTGLAASLSVSGVITDLKLFVNGNQINKEIVSINGSSYLPVRAIGEALNLNVAYNGSTKRIDISPKDKPVATEQPTTQEQPTPTVEVTVYKPGTYKVGSDIPAGEYKLFAEENNFITMGYLEITSDSSGNFDSIIANDNFSTFTYVTLKSGEYFNITGATAVPAKQAQAYKPQNGLYTEGMYKVGFDIPAGEYKVRILADNNTMGIGYLEVATNSRHKFDSIVTNDNFEGDTYITIKDGQYLTLTCAYIQQ